MIRWFTKNDIAANFVLVAILLAGAYMALYKIPLEVQPTRDYGQVRIDMTYRGGSPEDVEKYIIEPIEQVLRDLPGVEELEGTANRGSARVRIRAEDGIDLKELRDEVESRIDQITFPGETERPRISIPNSSDWREVVTVAVTGDLTPTDLYEITKRVQNDILELPEVSRTDLRGDIPLEIAIEADDVKLRDHDLAFQDLVDAIRRSSLALSAGSIRTPSGSIMIRTEGQAYEREEFEKIIVTAANGAQLKLSDLATIQDGFEEKEQIIRFNGHPALMIDVLQGKGESAIKISDAIKRYIEQSDDRFPEGINLHLWDDESIRIRGRISTLLNSLMMGGVLVLIVLGLFLRPMLAFWVVLGIPVSFAGGLILMPFFGLTANTMSIFGFIIVLGIVVDDAIVTGENIYSRLRDDMTPLDAAVLGTKQVATPVTFGVITTIVAFIPLMFFEGYWATWTTQIPPIVGAVLLFSLIESKLILPSHLKHLRTHRDVSQLNFFSRFQKAIADGLERSIEKFYAPLLRLAAEHRYTTVAIFGALALAAIGVHRGGHLGFVAIPTIERYIINARIDMLDNTPFEETDQHVKYVAACAKELGEELIDPGSGKSLVKNIMTHSGRHPWRNQSDPEMGFVSIEILPPSHRSVPGPTNEEITKKWREKVGQITGVQNFRVWGSWGGRGYGVDQLESMQIQLRGPDTEKKREIAQKISNLFQDHEEIEWANAERNRQRKELSISLKPRALELGLSQRALAQQIRQAFFGEQVQRIQRNGEEIRVMLRLPQEKRESMQTFETLNITAPNGSVIPLSTVATTTLTRAPGNITRKDGAQISNISAQPKSAQTDILALADALEPQISNIVNESPQHSWVWDGYIKEDRETGNRYTILLIGLLIVLYALLAIPFQSLLQPLIVLLAVPFGIIGAYGGHWIMEITPSWLSVFGILALTGVVVNDSLVLVDFINQKRAEGMEIREAVLLSGVKRFRPILLTSLTTFAGLMPLMFDRALHAQFLKPMAISLGYGILFATFITLILIPICYLLLEDLKRITRKAWQWYLRPFRKRSS